MSFGNIRPFYTNYGAASATGPGILTGPGTVQQLGGNKEWTNQVATQGTLVKWSPAAYLALTASTENPDVNYNLARTVQFATGALALQRAIRIQAPTYGFVGASTLSTAITLDISGPPVAGTNATITNAIALNVGGRIESTSTIRTTGATNPGTGTSGAGVELNYNSGGQLTAYDRTASAYQSMFVNGLTVQLRPSGTVTLTAAATKNTNTVPSVVPSFLVSTLPAASVGAGAMAYVTDAATAACLAISNGTNWKRSDNAATTVV